MEGIKFPARGFTFPYGVRTAFIVTDYKTNNEHLARKILRKLELPENPDTIKELRYWMQPAEIHRESAGSRGDYYLIRGSNFSQLAGFVDNDDVLLLEV